MGLFDRLRDLVGARPDDEDAGVRQPEVARARAVLAAAAEEREAQERAVAGGARRGLVLPPRHPFVKVVVGVGAPSDLVALVAVHGPWLVEAFPEPAPHRSYRDHESSVEAMAARLRAADDDQRRAAATLVLARLRSTSAPLWQDLDHAALTRLARRRLPWTIEQVGWLLRCTAEMPAMEYGSPRARTLETAALAVGAAERLGDEDGLPRLRADLEHLLERLETTSAAGARMASRVGTLLSAVGDRPASLPPTVLPVDDRYGRAARAALEAQHPPDLVVTVVDTLGEYGGSVVPTTRWRRTAERLLAAQRGSSAVAVALLQTLLDHDDHTVDRMYGGEVYPEPFFVDQGTGQLLRAAVWMVALAPDVSEHVALLGGVAVHCGLGPGGRGANARLSPVSTSVLAALAEVVATTTDPAALVGQLARVRTKVANKPIRAAADAALDQAAAALRVSPGELLEQAVSDFGLAPDGTAEVPVGACVALLALEDSRPGARLTTRWRTPTGRVVASVPAQVKESHPEQLAELRALAKEVTSAVSVQRARVEDLLATGRSWTGARWRACYVEHPVVGLVARPLLWQVRSGARGSTPGAVEPPPAPDRTWSSGLPERSGEEWLLRRYDGTAVVVSPDDEVRLWHPLDQPLAEVRAWRAHLSDHGLRQPFKQAFREIYLLTPAESATVSYSNRFAGHVLRYPQVGALMRARGWSGVHLGYWDGGQDGQATKELEGGWRASFYYEALDDAGGGYERVSLCSTDQVRFERRTGPRQGWEVRPLPEVPPLLLSEALRDVDLFVGVTSVAADPEWADRGPDRYQAYWRRESFGELGESAGMRREALERLLPRTKLAGCAELSDRFLVVHGHLRDYKIHLGSGNILMSPADTYLCIVAARGGTEATKVFLPFEEDGGKLAVILSKAFMFAEDTSIDDPSITRQLRLGL